MRILVLSSLSLILIYLVSHWCYWEEWMDQVLYLEKPLLNLVSNKRCFHFKQSFWVYLIGNFPEGYKVLFCQKRFFDVSKTIYVQLLQNSCVLMQVNDLYKSRVNQSQTDWDLIFSSSTESYKFHWKLSLQIIYQRSVKKKLVGSF